PMFFHTMYKLYSFDSSSYFPILTKNPQVLQSYLVFPSLYIGFLPLSFPFVVAFQKEFEDVLPFLIYHFFFIFTFFLTILFIYIFIFNLILIYFPIKIFILINCPSS